MKASFFPIRFSFSVGLSLSLWFCFQATLVAQEWPSFEDRVEFTHNGSLHAFWVPLDPPVDESLRVIVTMRGAGGGLQYPGDLMSALAALNWHAVLVQNSNSYSEIIATELVQELRNIHGLLIKDEIFVIGNSRGGQGVNRLMQQIPAGIGAAVSSNPGNLTTPSGRLFGQFPSNQGGWTDEEIGPVASGPPWTAQDDPRKMALGDPALPAFEQIPVMIHAGANDQERYPHSLFFAMEMQERGHSHFETLFNSSGHGLNEASIEAAVDFFLRVHENDGNTPPVVSIDGPRIITLSPGTTHTLTATATDAEDDDSTLEMAWRKVSLPNEPQFVENDIFSYAPRYLDGVEGWIPLHRYADIEVDGFNNTRDGGNPRVLSETNSLTFTVPTVEENTFVVIEARATDSEGFVGTDSVMVFINAAPRILEGPEDNWTVHQNATTPMRFRALDVDSAGLIWTLETGPANGTVDLIQSSGEFVELEFTPDENFIGEDSFVLQVTDALGLSSELTVNLTVANDALSFPAEMNAVRQRATDAAGSLTSGSTMLVKTGPSPNWMNIRSAYFRFPLEAIAGNYVSAQVKVYITERNQSGTELLTVYQVPENDKDGLAFAWGVAPNINTYTQIGAVELDSTGFVYFDVSQEVEAAMNAGERSLTLVFYADSRNGPIYASRHWPEAHQRPALEVVALTGNPESPSFSVQPENALVPDGESASFTVEVFGIPFPEIQWQKDGVNLEQSERVQGVNDVTLTIDPVQPGDAGVYRAVATNTLGTAHSAEATLVLALEPPRVLSQPEGFTVFAENAFSLEVEASGYPEIQSYQWFKDGVELLDDGRISGSQSSVLSVSETILADSGTYTLVITNSEGTVETDPIEMYIEPRPAFVLHLDFGTNHTNPGENWNSLNDSLLHTGLVNFAAGAPTGVEIEMITTRGRGIQTSGSTIAWGSRKVSPGWANREALDDRLFISNGDSATLRFTNLDPGKTYTLEIASGFDGGGTNGNEPGIFEIVGGEGSVEGFNAHSGENLGTQVYWTSRGPNDGGNKPYSVEGWMIWENVRPDEEGRIKVFLSTGSAGTARVSLNAARLFEDGEVVELGSFDSWMENYWEDLAEHLRGPTANPTGDGIPNLLKYALNLDPREQAEREDLPQMSIEEEGEYSYLTLHLNRNPTMEGAQLLVEYSEDLANWFSGSPDVEIVSQSDEGVIARSGHPVNSERPRQFLRVRVEM